MNVVGLIMISLGIAALVVFVAVTAQAQALTIDQIPQWKRTILGDFLSISLNLPKGCEMLKQTDSDVNETLAAEHSQIMRIKCNGD